MEHSRPIRVAQLLKERISKFLVPKLAEHWGVVSVTEVRVSNDLSTARVYLSFLKQEPTQKQIEEIVEPYLPGLRKEMRALRLKKIPRLKFYPSYTLRDSARIESLIDQL